MCIHSFSACVDFIVFLGSFSAGYVRAGKNAGVGRYRFAINSQFSGGAMGWSFENRPILINVAELFTK
jgi:hypothetical protein